MPIPIESLSPTALKKARMFDARALSDPTARGGKVIIYERPRSGIDYGMGGDWAYGIKGRDRDAFCVFGKFPDRSERGYQIRQVCQAWGWWGERVHRVVYAMLRCYNGALLCGERQVGLPTMRKLVDEYQYKRVYFDRKLARAGKPKTDVLGVARTKVADVILNAFRTAIAEDSVVLRSPELVAEMDKMQWVERGAAKPDRRLSDDNLVIQVLSGESPDLCMAAMYGYHAARCLHLFEPDEPPESDELPEDMRRVRKPKEVSFARPKR